MITIAQAISDADALAASEYFASLKPGVWTEVIETQTVPRTYVGAGGMRFAAAGDEQEPIGNRIIVLPRDETRAKSRDPHSGFVDHVPPGSIARGEALVATGDGGKTIPCMICHGQTLQGLGEVPAIVGRRSGAAELLRQGENGWICDPRDLEGLAKRMGEAAAASGDNRRQGAARATAESYGIDSMARSISELYAALAPRARK